MRSTSTSEPYLPKINLSLIHPEKLWRSIG